MSQIDWEHRECKQIVTRIGVDGWFPNATYCYRNEVDDGLRASGPIHAHTDSGFIVSDPYGTSRS